MTKACSLPLADTDTDTHEAMGRMANALTSTNEFVEAGDEAVVIFDGAGTRWVPELESAEHRYHRVYTELREHILGACSYCAQAFGVKDRIEASSVELLTDYRGYPSLHRPRRRRVSRADVLTLGDTTNHRLATEDPRANEA